MKKILFTLITLCLTCQFILAQNLRFGLAITPGISWLRTENDELKTRAKAAFGYGLTIDYLFPGSEKFSALSGVHISHNGGRYESTVIDTTNGSSTPVAGVKRLKLTYLDIPLTLKFKTDEIGQSSFVPFFQLGLTPSMAIRRRFDFTAAGQEYLTNEKANEFTNNLNISLTVAVGTEYLIGGDPDATKAFAAIHLDNGLLNIIDDNGGEKVARIMLGIRMGIYF